MRDLSKMGKAFDCPPLKISQLALSPFVQFELWLEDALMHPIPEANAMTLSTSDLNNQPNARTVLLKKYDETGFVFFGHYDSQKGQELAVNPKACLLFWWGPLNRQIRLQGSVVKLDTKSSDAYFHSRSLPSQIAASVSPQSKPLLNNDKNILISEYESLLTRHQKENTLPKRPDYWGGFKFLAYRFEFWQGSAHRLHDRFIYEYHEQNQNWSIIQLAP